MKKLIILIACALPFLGACTPRITPTTIGSGDVHTQPVGDACTEDMPCFDCHTMGNRVCGPVSARLGDHDGTITFRDGAERVLHGYVMETAEGVTLLRESDGTALAFVPWNRVELPDWSIDHHAMNECLRTYVDCHYEVETDGSVHVYGKEAV